MPAADDLIAEEATNPATSAQSELNDAPLEEARAFEAWKAALSELLDNYCDVQRRALLLAGWRRPQRRERRERRALIRKSGFLRALRAGESVLWMFPPQRRLVNYFVADHVGARLRLLRRCVLVSNRLGNDEQDQLLAIIDRVLPLWSEHSVVRFFYGYVVPLSATVAAVGHWFLSGLTDPENTIGLFTLLCFYAGAFLVMLLVAFVTKRGLMLGGSGFTASVPASLDGQGTYAVEARVFGVLAPARRETPLDLVLLATALPLFTVGALGLLLLTSLPPWVPIAAACAITSGWIALSVVTFARRRRLGRC